ncbi:MAG: hypothetical protein F6K19_20200 [Cyanothece sp. SIO1E1]|nr:hypothetical protein [Cyanothece sp. SIO1E1]
MFRKVAIIELYDHGEVLRDTYYLLKEVSQQILIFTTPGIKDDLESIGLEGPNLNWELILAQQSHKQFLEARMELLQSCDSIFLLTINRPFAFYSTLPFLSKTILLIHNTHAFLTPWRNIAWSRQRFIEILLRVMRYYFSGDRHHLKKILSETRVWAFPSEGTQQYAEEVGAIFPGKPTVVLPLGLPDSPAFTLTSDHELNICVPGTIKENGRDYGLLYAGITALLRMQCNRIRLCLLGRPQGTYGQRIQEEFLELQLRYPQMDLAFFTEEVSQETYDRELQNASFLVLPLLPRSRYDAFHEQIGFSTVTGGVNDMSRFGIPAIVPHFYPLESWRENLVERYNTEEDFCHKLFEWISERKYTMIQQVYSKKQRDRKILLQHFIVDFSKGFEKH